MRQLPFLYSVVHECSIVKNSTTGYQCQLLSAVSLFTTLPCPQSKNKFTSKGIVLWETGNSHMELNLACKVMCSSIRTILLAIKTA